MTEFDAFREWQARIWTHPASVADGRWKSLRRSYLVHMGNASELLEQLEVLATNIDVAVRMVAVDPPDPQRHAFWLHLQRRLHNYVASYRSLIDHSRRLVARYPADGEFRREYDRRKAELGGLPVSQFLGNLRNYVVHVEHPALGYTVSFSVPAADEERFDAAATLSSAELLEWDGWRASEREFIRSATNGHVDLREVVALHVHATEQLYGWLFRQFLALHGDDVDEVNRIVAMGPPGLAGGAPS